MDIQLILTSWLLCIIALCFIRLKWAVSLFMAYLMLVPYMNLGLPGVGTGDNFIKLLMVICLWKKISKQKVRVNFVPFIPFIVYFGVSLFIIPFQSGVPISIMLDTWRKDIMNVIFLPIVMWNIILIDSSSIKLFRNTMIICIAISIGYGLFLTTMDGVNPYALYFLQFRESDADFESYYEASNGGRLFGRISSVYIHPMTFALFVGLALIYLYYIRKRVNGMVSGFFISGLICATIFMAIVCGVRSVIGGILIALMYYVGVQRNFKLFFMLCGIGVLGVFLISFLPELSDYLGSIIDINNKKGDVSGSSISMRLDQLNGAINEASTNPLFGLGYKWTDYYQSIKGDHPICLAFESLVFVVVCNSGIIGIILWSYMILKYFVVNRKMKIEGLPVVNALMIFYISYSIITGEYGYMKLFLIFYVLMIGEFSRPKRMKIK